MIISRLVHRWLNLFMIVLVGIEDDLDILKDRLTGPELKLEVVPIVGMGGIGKTTLAENIYRDSLIVYHFNVRAWITVSQVYDVKDILLQLLGSLGIKENDEMLMKREDELALQVHKILYSRRYLIVMDDLWSTKAWDDFKKYFRNYGNGSRIILTTRIESVALHASSSGLHFMNHLCPFNSWKLLQDKVFKEEECPSQLHAVGKHIVFHCRGLPLAIVVIAGILINVNRTIDEWKKVAEYMHSITNRDSDTCLEILFLSYSHLPQHLKPCFLYMGVFPEDSKIAVSKVIKLWAVEGFLKQNEARTVEEVAEDYILELAQRSLISVFRKRRRTHKFGRMKTISVHDLLRDLCIREAQKEKLLHVIKSPGDGFPREMNHQRCVCIYPNIPLEDPFFKCLKHLSTTRVFSKPISFARSLVYTGVHPFPSPVYQYCFRLLKVLDISQVLFFEFPLEILTLYNLRYLAFSYHGEIPDSISRLWNLQTLIFSPLLKSFSPCPIPLPLALWSMPRLRHLRFHVLYLSDFPCVLSGWRTGVFLANLQTLTEVSATFCQEEILKEMPNLKKLGIWMEKWDDAPFYINSNLACLEKLEVLKCSVRSFPTQEIPIFPNYFFLPELAFPTRLKELVLRSCRIPWKDMSIVGTLPNLEVLKLRDNAFVGPKWEPTEGEFSRLSFLYIDGSDLMHWEADDLHFPHLRHLIVENCRKLAAIPNGIGEIGTLEIIEIDTSSPSAVTSVEFILEEQKDLGNDGLRLHIYPVGATFS